MTLGSTRWVHVYPFSSPSPWQGPFDAYRLYGTSYMHLWEDPVGWDYGDKYEAMVQLHVVSRLLSGPATLVEVWTWGNIPEKEDLIGRFTVSSSTWTDFTDVPRQITINEVIPSGHGLDRCWIKVLGSGRVECSHMYFQEVKFLDFAPIPPLITYRLNVPGMVDNFKSAPPGEPVVQYGSGIWNDGSDATYAGPFGWSDLMSTSCYGVLDKYTGGVIKGMKLHFRASASTEDQAAGKEFIPITAHILRGVRPTTTTLLRFYGGSYAGAWGNSWVEPLNFVIQNDNVVRDYEAVVTYPCIDNSGWSDIDQMRPDLTTNTCGLFFDSDGLADGYDPIGTIRIHQAWLTVDAVT